MPSAHVAGRSIVDLRPDAAGPGYFRVMRNGLDRGVMRLEPAKEWGAELAEAPDAYCVEPLKCAATGRGYCPREWACND